MATVPTPKEIIYNYELNVVQTEAVLDLIKKNKAEAGWILLFDIDGSREIRKKGIVLRLEIIKKIHQYLLSIYNQELRCFWYGNDEFIVLLKAECKENAYIEADTIRRQIEGYRLDIEENLENVSYHGFVTVTGGLVGFHETTDVIDLVRLARLRVAKGKDNGKNCICDEGDNLLDNYLFRLTKDEYEELCQLSDLKQREVECLLREAVDTILAHYPQFHGHRSDREMKLPPNAFAYACSSTGLYVDHKNMTRD